jgi:hypothetical protein
MSNALLFCVAYSDGREPKIIRATTARGAVLGRLKDDEDGFGHGVAAVWRLGSFPVQFDITGPEPREMGRSRVS